MMTAYVATEAQPIRFKPLHCTCGRFLLNYRPIPGLWLQVRCRSCKQTTVMQIPEG